jgi:hypothetical protein
MLKIFILENLPTFKLFCINHVVGFWLNVQMTNKNCTGLSWPLLLINRQIIITLGKLAYDNIINCSQATFFSKKIQLTDNSRTDL